MEQSSEQKGTKQISITVSRDNIINAVVGAQLVLLIFFGWQIVSIKKQINNGDVSVAKAAAKTAQVVDDSVPTNAIPPAPEPVVDITVTKDDHMRGNASAPVTIVEYSDFECPFCERAHPTVKQVLQTYGDDVRLVYRHFPLSFHPQAQKAAEATECAADQNKFWEFHDKIFDNQGLLASGVPQLKTWAAELGLNIAKFNDCLDSNAKAAAVTADTTQGSRDGVTGTPAFFINGIKISGAQPFSAFKQVIDSELAAAK